MVPQSYSIILPAFNEAGQIEACLDSIAGNDSGDIQVEVIVADNGSTDGTVALALGRGVRVIENTSGRRLTISALRNRGAEAARGEVLAFLDADMLVPSDWLAKMRLYFDGTFQGALGFIETVPDEAGWVGGTWGNYIYLRPAVLARVDYLTGRNLIVHRQAFEQVGGFAEDLETGEDKEFTFRLVLAGFPALIVPDTRVVHLGYERGLGEFIRKEYWRQNSTMRLARRMNYSLRSMRDPLLSFWHLAALVSMLAGLAVGSGPLLLAGLLAQILPSLAITLRKPGRRGAPLRFLLSYYVLCLIRWNVSGLSLLAQGVAMLTRRGRR